MRARTHTCGGILIREEPNITFAFSMIISFIRSLLQCYTNIAHAFVSWWNMERNEKQNCQKMNPYMMYLLSPAYKNFMVQILLKRQTSAVPTKTRGLCIFQERKIHITTIPSYLMSQANQPTNFKKPATYHTLYKECSWKDASIS